MMWIWRLWSISLLVVMAACSSADHAGKTPSAPAPTASGEAGWEKIVVAATQEGKVLVSGPTRETWRKVLLSFEEDFPDIKVEYVGANSRDFWPRVFREREFGQFLWDLRVGGPDPEVYEAKDKGILDPVRPLLVLPEVADPKNWVGGFDRMFFDKEKKYVVGFANFISFMVYVNRDVIPETELGSIQDLTNPRWRGKIAIQDPRGGSGLNSLEVFLKIYGEEDLKDLLMSQDVVVTNDIRQQAEWVIRGRYPIGIGLVPDAFLVFEEQGLRFHVQVLKDSGNSISTGTAGIQLLNRAPHPNATKVYINWLLTKKIQSRMAAATKQNSRRVDVPAADPGALPDSKRMDSYILSQAEELLPVRRRAQQLAKEFLR